MRACARGWMMSLLGVGCSPSQPWRSSQRAGNTVVVSQAVRDDLYLAAGTVMTTAAVDGDLLAAGGTVDLGGDVTGSVMAAGGALAFGGTIGRSLRAAGGTVTIDARVMSDALLAGGVVRVHPAARVGRDLVAGGGTVTLAGMVGRNALIGGGDVVIGGTINGDAEIQANRVVLLPTARIGGALRYSADQPVEVQAGAQVVGGTTQMRAPSRPRRMVGSPLDLRFRLWRSLAETIALLVLGFVTFAIAPRGASAVVREARERFWRSLVVGFVLLVTVPVAAVLLAFTVIAIPVSVIAMLLYLATFYPGQVFVAAWLGQSILTGLRKGSGGAPPSFWALLVGAIVLVILFAVPFAGWAIRLVAVFSGFGALWTILWAGVTSHPVTSGT